METTGSARLAMVILEAPDGQRSYRLFTTPTAVHDCAAWCAAVADVSRTPLTVVGIYRLLVEDAFVPPQEEDPEDETEWAGPIGFE